jgi:hypothetical protein
MLKRIALRRNATKVATLERRIVRNADLLTTITDEDRDTLGASVARDRSIVITPGYAGPVVGTRRIGTETPRRAIIMGSFGWVVKQANLTRFLEIADPMFKDHGLELDIVGSIPQELLDTLKARCQATHFHGFVTDARPYLERARIGIVPESIGGGFKLKFLDYIFGRVPVATVSQAVAGLSEELQLSMLKNDSLEGLVKDIIAHISIRLARQGHTIPPGDCGNSRKRYPRLRLGQQSSRYALAERRLGGGLNDDHHSLYGNGRAIGVLRIRLLCRCAGFPDADGCSDNPGLSQFIRVFDR